MWSGKEEGLCGQIPGKIFILFDCHEGMAACPSFPDTHFCCCLEKETAPPSSVTSSSSSSTPSSSLAPPAASSSHLGPIVLGSSAGGVLLLMGVGGAVIGWYKRKRGTGAHVPDIEMNNISIGPIPLLDDSDSDDNPDEHVLFNSATDLKKKKSFMSLTKIHKQQKKIV